MSAGRPWLVLATGPSGTTTLRSLSGHLAPFASGKGVEKACVSNGRVALCC